MPRERDPLLERLREHYRSQGWKVRDEQDGVVAATGPGGVDWLGIALDRGDFEDSGALDDWLMDLARRHMPEGELRPLDVLATEECEPALRCLLERLGLDRRPHVSVYSLAA